jgi:hypothetical protein
MLHARPGQERPPVEIIARAAAADDPIYGILKSLTWH